jgi:hypothetical protein
MTRFCYLIPLALGPLRLMSGAAAPVPDHLRAGGPPLYFPTSVGAEWVYQGGDDEHTERVVAVEEKEGTFVVSYGQVEKDGGVPWVNKVSVSADGLADLGYTRGEKKVTYATPDVMLKLPFKADQVWDGPIGVGDTRKSVASERVKVPAGTFEAIKVDYELKADNLVLSAWYAPGVGRVKASSHRGRELVLKSFTREKK